MFKRKNEGAVQLGDKHVKVPKLTPAKWRELFSAIETLPNLVLQVLAAPAEDKRAYIMVAIDEGLDEVCGVVALLADLDADYVKNEAGLDEIIEFLTKTAKANRLNDAVKNARSLLGNQADKA